MRAGKLYPIGDFKADCWVKVYETTIGNGNLLTNGNFEGWVGGTDAAPDGWTQLNGAIARESTIVKVGTYSAKLTRTTDDTTITTTFGLAKGEDYWRTQTITFGCWVYATVASRARIQIDVYDIGTAYSSYHTGSSTWEWLTVTQDLTENPTLVNVGVAFRVDTGDTTAYFDGAVCKIGASLAETTSTDNFEATSLTISGLTGDTDKEYKLEARIVNGYNGGGTFYVRPNNDDGSNYGFQYIDGTNATASAGRNTSQTYFVNIGQCGALGDVTQGNMLIYAKSGYVRTCINEMAANIATTTVATIQLMGQSWNNTADEITSLVVSGNVANGLGIGTEVTLWKKEFHT